MSSGQDGPTELKRRRTFINNINEVIVEKIAVRMEQVAEIKRIKEESDIPITDGSREETVVSQFETLFEENDLDPDHGRELAELLIEIAKEEQRE
jgi:chorismate mutase